MNLNPMNDLNTTMPNSVLTTRIDRDLEKEQKENRPQNKKDKTKISYSKSIKLSNINHQLPDTTFRNQHTTRRRSRKVSNHNKTNASNISR